MIPLLFEETSIEWTVMSSGFIGMLRDCISCTTTEERNGIFELEMRYPVDGAYFSSITNRSIITAIPSPYRDPEPFRVYKIEYKSLDGTAYIYAEHISYDLKGFLMFRAGLAKGTYSLSDMITAFNNAIKGIDTSKIVVPFVFTSDITETTATIDFSVEQLFGATVRKMMSGTDGSITDSLGYGEWELSGNKCILHKSRGTDIGLDIKYGYNITTLKASVDCSDNYGGVQGYYIGSYEDESTEKEQTVAGYWFEPYNKADRKYEKWLSYDCSDDFEVTSSQDMRDKLKARVAELAEEYCADPEWSISVSFLDLNKMLGHSIVPIAKPDLCDIVTVSYEPLGLDGVKAEITEIETDVLKEIYNEVTIGKLKGSIAKTVAGGGKK